MIAAAKIAAQAVRWALQAVRQLGPYAAIELLLPGGSLLAILLWLYRRRTRDSQRSDLFRNSTGKPLDAVLR